MKIGDRDGRGREELTILGRKQVKMGQCDNESRSNVHFKNFAHNIN